MHEGLSLDFGGLAGRPAGWLGCASGQLAGMRVQKSERQGSAFCLLLSQHKMVFLQLGTCFCICGLAAASWQQSVLGLFWHITELLRLFTLRADTSCLTIVTSSSRQLGLELRFTLLAASSASYHHCFVSSPSLLSTFSSSRSFIPSTPSERSTLDSQSAVVYPGQRVAVDTKIQAHVRIASTY